MAAEVAPQVPVDLTEVEVEDLQVPADLTAVVEEDLQVPADPTAVPAVPAADTPVLTALLALRQVAPILMSRVQIRSDRRSAIRTRTICAAFKREITAPRRDLRKPKNEDFSPSCDVRFLSLRQSLNPSLSPTSATRSGFA